ncbi:UDP-galactose transporter 1 [Fulvia fulva]|uniref:UDP-galactose transporter 1 n=1 Tax=Passalora fulva TaxID=5499 RepID=A0A9Q8PDU2_PASFU|nr:UDP-galactose transporter 1 [Fulvia fulva]KAK4617560.1 UDP-galactose transporter 1 [Fulvia fulva]KAK4618937.1 UDP-galactose transporter 1 [Fulvia fulva]UJO20744.1 UDP-galactose transporter 1 [Fulvia fulva]WPV17886.1 UDP-galactose transporter 1 [Fulvia fulva]WPV32890.1 UDP-galactose transporter 1 [Fulvia fulva]
MDEKSEMRVSTRSMDSTDRSELSSIAEEDHELLEKGERDLESQAIIEQQPTPTEYSTSTSKKLVYLALYFLLNLSVTLSNKALLQGVSFPWLLTFAHTTATSLGCTTLLLTGQLKLSKLSLKDNIILVVFSTLFTLNIAISNVSLALVSVPFHQVMRSTCPVATILIYKFGYNRAYSTQTWLSMIPLVLGVGLATFGDYYFTMAGFLLTLLGVVLAAIKTVATNNLMTGSLKLSAMEVLFRMCPLAALQCLLYAAGSGEIGKLQAAVAEGLISTNMLFGIATNAAMAFGLNVVSFQTNKVAGALTISVCGNVKQVMTIMLGIVLFSVKVGPMNAAGMLVATAGAAYYSKVEMDRKKAASTT